MTVVIPARNEERNLPYVLTRLPRDLHEVILVDGGSTDGTIAVARQIYPRIRVVNQSHTGKGNALVCGFAVCTGDIIVMLDADGSADAAEIPRFVAALQHGADFAKGSRFMPGGGTADITRFRALGNAGLNRLVNFLFGTRYSDLCYGYNAFWAHCLPYMQVDTQGFEVETLINVRIAKAHLRVHEVPSYEGQRVHGVSNLNAFRDGFRVLKTILAERFGNPPGQLMREQEPVRVGHGWDGIERRTGQDRRSGSNRRAVVRGGPDRRDLVDRRASGRFAAGYPGGAPAVQEDRGPVLAS